MKEWGHYPRMSRWTMCKPEELSREDKVSIEMSMMSAEIEYLRTMMEAVIRRLGEDGVDKD